MTKKQKIMLVRILVTAAMLIALKFIPVTGILQLALYLVAYLVIGYDILRKAGKGILNGRAFDENFLMALATLGAFFLAVWTRSGDYVEGIAVMLFYQIGELFQSYAVGKSRKNISALMDIRPDYANIEKDGSLAQVAPDEVPVGSIIVVQPGEKVPLDGVVVEGAASLNTSALTGESLPRDVREGEEIISGCIDMNGVLKVRTTKEFGESTVSKILDLVENASSRKSRSEAFISRFARVYTPAVCAAALALAILVPCGLLIAGKNPEWTQWIYRALSFLVVSCPCALVISIPLSFFAGIGGASKQGILIKGSNFLEELSDAKYVVFDKTGTLTQGVFEVTGVHHSELERAQLIEYAALAECASSHPISRSLQKAYGKAIDRNRVTDIEEISGEGVTAKVDGRDVAAGNGKLMKRLGVDEVRSELLPADKVAEVEKLLTEKGSKGKLAFVGDGINDAPVLTRADIGIAMGAMGSDAAIEAADVVLMDDDPLQIAKAIKISRKCIGIVRQNIVFSLVVKFACLALTAVGLANMWVAIFADVGVMIIAVLNAIRALKE